MFPLFLLELTPPELRDELSDFYEKYQGEFIRYAKTLLFRKGRKNVDTDAEDILQSTFYKLIKSHCLDFSMGEKSVKSYVIMTIESVTNDYLNRNKIFFSLDEEYEPIERVEDSFFEKLLIKERFKIVVSELGNLDPIYSCTLLLRMNEWKAPEIARYMRVSEQTVYTRIRRGMKLLLQRLKARDDYE